MTIAGAAMGAADNIDFFSDILGLMWSQAGVEIPAGLDSKSAADALKFYTDFIKIYGVWDRNMTEASTAFANEKVSMIFAPSWILSDILEARPNLQVGVAPVPQAILDQPVAWGSFWMTAVPVTSTHPDVAWDFINFLSQEDQQLMLFNENSSVRKLASPFSLVSLNSQLSTNPYLKPYVDTASFARGGVMSARAGNKTQIDLLKKAVNSVLDGTKPEDALNVMVNTK
jgi:ABC-type glycerol-3-phosphate transport system substrate-binding protein